MGQFYLTINKGEQKSFSTNMMNGVARLIYAYGAELKDNIFKEKLSEISIKEICKVAKERRAGSLGYAEAMLIFYSKRMKNAPHWKKLYESKKNRAAEVMPIEPSDNENSDASPDNPDFNSDDNVGIQAG